MARGLIRSARLALLIAALGWSTAAAALEPFIAQYEVYRNGSRLGVATMQLSSSGNDRWRIDLVMRGTGLMRVAGINAEQSTVFDTVGETYRPLSQATLRRAVFMRRRSTGVYDWSTRQARWQGDVKETRRAPVPLQPGDMSGLLINLAVIRDAHPGRTLQYRFVDGGRVREQRYTVATEPEPVTVDGMSYSALRVTRVQDDAEKTAIWVVEGVPTPVRILQHDDGEDTYDLRLIEYRGNE